ncbi:MULTISPECIES: A24 family peptidase [unclassified Curtobacterium]|uniref:prepilin peptidase n=1 Tax=unclassified Curtobacterium TaxID=257496 RepID=UPI000DAA5DF1|nr:MULTISPECIES: A24 family peptidase [unclassified Curtobacterium]PZE28203.1 prepilin peptidase [Curtobacterium sp. MCBD17_028]PZF62637.1 prepilin peptidase [Curtobacterium sp. MCBD17_034]PZM40123.1 prepilin peptidase [Curtobacterium sp. MCBD17_031]
MTTALDLGPLVATLGGVFGLLIGSFLNVVVYRVPAHVSIVSPPSACPRCDHPIRGYDNVPVLSWLVLRGRCRDCGAPISSRYPLVELATGLLFVVVALRFWPATTAGDRVLAAHVVLLLAFLYLMAISVALALIDVDTHTLPNAITYPSSVVLAVLLAGASALSGDWAAFVRGVIGAAALGVLYLVLAIAVPGGMGLGDVKLAGILGLALAYLGWGPLAVGAFGAFLVGGIFALVLVAARRAKWRGGIPFGPSMLTGAWIGVLVGAPASHAYLHLIGLA